MEININLRLEDAKVYGDDKNDLRFEGNCLGELNNISCYGQKGQTLLVNVTLEDDVFSLDMTNDFMRTAFGVGGRACIIIPPVADKAVIYIRRFLKDTVYK